MKIKLNCDLLKYKKGATIDIKAVNGIPADRYWRKRLKDSKTDNCISIVKEDKRSVKPIIEEKKPNENITTKENKSQKKKKSED